MVENTRIKGAIFDKDGILFNTEVFYNEAWKLEERILVWMYRMRFV